MQELLTQTGTQTLQKEQEEAEGPRHDLSHQPLSDAQSNQK